MDALSRSVSRKLIAVLFRGRCMDEAVAASRSNRTLVVALTAHSGPERRAARRFWRGRNCARCPYCIAEVGEGEVTL